jgi:hypothetical protein
MTNKYKFLLTAISGMMLFSSCFKKDVSITTLETYPASDIAYVKFINTYTAAYPTTVTPAAGPLVNVYINDVKINGTSTSAPIAYAAAFPQSPSYTAVKPGLGINIKVILNRTNNTPVVGDTISNKNYDLGVNSYTTFYITDTIPNPTPFNPYVVSMQELITNAPVGFFRARFVNMIPSTDTLEVFSPRLNAVIFKGQLYKNASEIIELPTYTTTDALVLRRVNTTTSLATLSLLPTSERFYTVYCTGNITGTPRARALNAYINR